MLLDKLIVGKMLKGVEGKTVGQVLKRLGILAAAGGTTNGGQQAWLNTVASKLAKYDPERPMTQDVWDNVLLGTILSPVGGVMADSLPRGGGAKVESRWDFKSRTTFGEPAGNGSGWNRNGDQRGVGKKSFENELSKFRKAFESLGVGVNLEGTENQNRLVGDRIILDLNPEGMSGREFLAINRGFAPGEASRLMLGEELRHAAYLVALKEEWIAGGKKTDFETYVKDAHLKIFEDIQKVVKSAPEAEIASLMTALRDSYNLYFKDHGRDLGATEGFDALLKSTPDGRHERFVSEFLRQASQLKRQGKLNEQLLARIGRVVADWVDLAITRTRRVMPEAYGGKFGPEVQNALLITEARLRSIAKNQ